uniref:Putative reverse transcriptase domain-containing protein n=1 Tax=Tanacetum cinerariifolium TaxID=118510 RepID=A0A6L2P9S7_TANCI|nr:putative reverse transcriptase domain-containing protein [Tanacetum cinerariifolium]
MRCASFEALYGRKCHSLIIWEEVGEDQLIGPELVQETIEKISQIKDRLKVARDHQKSYADKRRKPLEFSVGLVAYRVRLPEELNGVHDTFYVSNLKKCLADPTLQVRLDEIQVDTKLNFMEELVEILEREFKKLKRSRISIVKVRWDSKRGPEFTWEREDQMKLEVCPVVNAPVGRLLAAYELGVTNPRALVHAGDKTSGDARSFKIDKRKRFKLTLEVFKDFFKICPRVQGQDFDALPTNEEIMSFLRDLGHTKEIHSLNDIYGAILPESLTSPKIKETKAYKTYLGFATGATPPKKVRKFKKPASPKLTIVSVSTEEPRGKSKRVKRHAKKSTRALVRGVVIRETPEIPVSKKEKKEELKGFHKTRPSGSGTTTKPTTSTAIIKPTVTNEGIGDKPGVPDVTEEESSETKIKSWGNDEDDNNNDQDSRSDQEKASDDDKTQSNNKNELNSKHETNESGSESDQEEDEEKIEDDEEEEEEETVKTLFNDSDDEDETKVVDKAEGNEYEEMGYTTSLLYDDVDIRLNEAVDIDKGFVQEESTDAAMTNIQQENENPKILQVIEDAYVALSTVLQKTKVPVTSSSHSSDLAAKFLKFADISYLDDEIVSPLDVHIHHEVPSQQTPTLFTLHVLVSTDSSLVFSTIIPQSLPSFTPPPQQSSPTLPPTTKDTNPSSTLPDFASVFQFNN